MVNQILSRYLIYLLHSPRIISILLQPLFRVAFYERLVDKHIQYLILGNDVARRKENNSWNSVVLVFHVDLQSRAYEIKTFKWARNKVHREKVNFLILYNSVTK